MGVCPLSVTDVFAYFDALGIESQETRLEWFEILSAVDDEYLEAVEESRDDGDA